AILTRTPKAFINLQRSKARRNPERVCREKGFLGASVKGLCVSVVKLLWKSFTTEAQRSFFPTASERVAARLQNSLNSRTLSEFFLLCPFLSQGVALGCNLRTPPAFGTRHE